MKKVLALLLAVIVVLSFASCGKKVESPESINVAVLSGPTGIGALNLWSLSEKGEAKQNYNFTLSAANDEIVAKISSGDADIAAVATNLASALYNKTDAGVTVLAVNTESVLYMLSNGAEIGSISDVKGKTVYLPGQGANPEYTLRYVLTKNGIDPDNDVNLQFVSDGSELPAVWAKEENKDALILSPQPVATSILTKYENAKQVLNLGKEWEMVGDGKLLMGCVVVRNEFLNTYPEAVKVFLEEYKNSIETAKTDVETTAELCEEKGIIAKSALAKKAIPYCGLTYLSGKDMKDELSAYLSVMFDANPKSVGGKLPEDNFYYEENS